MLYFSANSVTSTVSLPPAHPDDERGADEGFPILHSDHDTGNNNDTPSSASTEPNDLKAADDYSNAVVIGNESNSTEVSDGEISVVVICEQVIQKKTIEDKSNGILLLGAANDNKKQRRKRRTVATPLETVTCRGACGGGSNCVSKGSDQQVGYLHCENYERDNIKCPLWVGMACASKFNNFKCRICVLLDAPQALKR
jgi:hypothetical protein